MGLFGGNNQSSAATLATSGFGTFKPDNEVSRNNPIIDFSKPMQIFSLIAVLVISAYAYKRFK